MRELWDVSELDVKFSELDVKFSDGTPRFRATISPRPVQAMNEPKVPNTVDDWKDYETDKFYHNAMESRKDLEKTHSFKALTEMQIMHNKERGNG